MYHLTLSVTGFKQLTCSNENLFFRKEKKISLSLCMKNLKKHLSNQHDVTDPVLTLVKLV